MTLQGIPRGNNYVIELTGVSATFSSPLHSDSGIKHSLQSFAAQVYTVTQVSRPWLHATNRPTEFNSPPRCHPTNSRRCTGVCRSRSTDADSIVNITTNGTAVLRVTWSNGRGSSVFTNDCTYTVLAEPPTPTDHALSSAAAAPPPSALLPAALLLLLALLPRPLC